MVAIVTASCVFSNMESQYPRDSFPHEYSIYIEHKKSFSHHPWGAVDAGCVEAFLAVALSRVMCATVPIPAVAAASVAVGGSVVGVVGLL